jgi:murein DD-endopeptidase MepM/ murein hydrolase activator NlpD
MKRKIISVILIFILLQSVVLAATTSDLNNQKSDIQNKINEAQDQQLDIEDELDDQMKEISSLDAEISEVEEEISKLKAQISELETSIEEKQTELEKKQKEYEENDELLQERLVATYENGDTTFLDILFNSSNIIDFLSNYYTISQLVECDQELLESIEKEEQEIEETKNNLEEQKQEVEELKSSQETKANTLKLKRAERQTKVSELNDEQKKLQEQIDSYNEDIKKIDEQIKEIYEQAQKQAQASGLKFDGSFIWPCNNKVITSTVKVRWGRWHKGLDIGASYESVYAAASGYAYTLENPGGYGHYIMIVHGSGYITLYGHLNSFNITSGQYVSQGQVIATSGNSGASQGAHLHFEIRKASSVSNYFSSDFLNPLDYLPGGYTYAAGATTSS